MNVNFEMAIQYINLEAYDKAVESLEKAISEENENNNEQAAIEYTCVLAELLADLDRKQDAKVRFLKVLEYCERTNSLPKQRQIAKDFLDFLSGNAQLVTAAPDAPSVPINVLNMQSKGFISRQQRKRGKK